MSSFKIPVRKNTSGRGSIDWTEWIHDFVTMANWIIMLVLWWRKGNRKVPYGLRRGVAGGLAILFLFWAVLDIAAFGLFTFNAAKGPGFFVPASLVSFGLFAGFGLFLTLIVPGGIMGYAVSRLVPEDPPWNREKKPTSLQNESPPYIVAKGPYSMI